MMDAYELIHRELTRVGIGLAATLPDDWVGPLIGRIDADPAIRHVPVARESEAVVVASGAFFANCKPKTAQKPAVDANITARLWQVSANLVGLAWTSS